MCVYISAVLRECGVCVYIGAVLRESGVCVHWCRVEGVWCVCTSVQC